LLYSRKGVTSPEFSIKDLPGSGGRMDLICRSIISALWLSNEMRKDTRINICLNGPPDPPLSLRLDGERLKKMSPDERNVATWLKKCLKYRDIANDSWTETHNGIYISKLDFEGVLEEINKSVLYILQNEGRDIRKIEFQDESAFILGDNIGLPENIIKRCEQLEAKKISLGPRNYFSSHSITLVHNEIDRREKREFYRKL